MKVENISREDQFGGVNFQVQANRNFLKLYASSARNSFILESLASSPFKSIYIYIYPNLYDFIQATALQDLFDISCLARRIDGMGLKGAM